MFIKALRHAPLVDHPLIAPLYKEKVKVNKLQFLTYKTSKRDTGVLPIQYSLAGWTRCVRCYNNAAMKLGEILRSRPTTMQINAPRDCTYTLNLAKFKAHSSPPIPACISQKSSCEPAAA